MTFRTKLPSGNLSVEYLNEGCDIPSNDTGCFVRTNEVSVILSIPFPPALSLVIEIC